MTFPRRTRGFSLIEILVVVVIVGIVASVALLSVNLVDDDRELQTEARRFAALIEVVRDEALMQGREFGIEVMQHAYRFVEFDPFSRQWSEVPADEMLRMRQLPDDAEFRLYLEGQRISLDADAAELDPGNDDGNDQRRSRVAESYEPHIYVFSSGDITPFELGIGRPVSDEAVRLRQPPLGDIEFVEQDE